MTQTLKFEHIDALVNLLADSAASGLQGTPQEFFQNLVAAAHLPKVWVRAIAGRWTGNAEVDARRLVEWALTKNVNPDDPRYTALGALLSALLAQRPSPEDARSLVAILLSYSLIPDKALSDDIRLRYNVPAPPGAVRAPVADYGPEIDWRGPSSDLELQSFFRPDPPWLDVGFLRRAMARSASVCRVEIGPVSGTGFLAASTMVLTNYHVLAPNPGDDLQANLARALLRFGCFTASGGDAAEGKTFKPIRLVDQSPIAELDFVLLEVDPAIRGEEAIAPAPFDLNLPAVGSALNILHHPGGDTMKLSTSGNGVSGVYQDRGYLQYVTKAIEGSSGSPCFNDDWKVVGLHHAQRARSFGSVREGILIASIYKRIQNYL